MMINIPRTNGQTTEKNYPVLKSQTVDKLHYTDVSQTMFTKY